jgi:hypothetical protein
MNKVRKFTQVTSEKKIPKLAPKTIIFEVLEADKVSSQVFMTDSFFGSKNSYSGQISRF